MLPCTRPVYRIMHRALLILLLVALTHSAHADTVQVEGILVVSGCQGASYHQISLSEPEILKIAAGCANRGVPLAVLVDDGDGGVLYTLVSPSPLLADHLAKRARMSGRENAPRVVIPEKLEIRTEAGWEEVTTTT